MRILVIVLLSASFLATEVDLGWATSRPCVPAKKGERFQVDFNQVPLKTVARLVSCAAEWNIVFQPPDLARRPVQVVASRPVKLSGLIRLFHAVLRSHGLRARRAGGYRVIERR